MAAASFSRRSFSDAESVGKESYISESFNELEMPGGEDGTVSGYLLKKSTDGNWQRRYFEINGTFLTYYKSRKMTKLLAALNMPSVGEISLIGKISDSLGEGIVFQLELKDKSYVLRAKDMNDAQRWIEALQKTRDLAKADVILEETSSEADHTRPSEKATAMETHQPADATWAKKSPSKCNCCAIQ